MSRKIIQIAVMDSALFALCDDGTLWKRLDPASTAASRESDDWYPVKPVPQEAPRCDHRWEPTGRCRPSTTSWEELRCLVCNIICWRHGTTLYDTNMKRIDE